MAVGSKAEYKVISVAHIQDQRDLVVSECSKGGYTVAQRVSVVEGKKTTYMYLKNAIHIKDLDGVRNLRDALNVVLSGE